MLDAYRRAEDVLNDLGDGSGEEGEDVDDVDGAGGEAAAVGTNHGLQADLQDHQR
jgi:hypothetical protein